MIVAGFGFRSGVTLQALQDALASAGGAQGVTHLATLATKSEGLRPLATNLGLPVVALEPEAPRYKHPNKNWRLKQGAMPQWYKARNGVRTKAQSGAARVARFRPPRVR